MTKLKADIQDGITSGPATAWDPEEAKRAARDLVPAPDGSRVLVADDTDDWDTGKLGRDERYAKRADPEHEEALEAAAPRVLFKLQSDVAELKAQMQRIENEARGLAGIVVALVGRVDRIEERFERALRALEAGKP